MIKNTKESKFYNREKRINNGDNFRMYCMKVITQSFIYDTIQYIIKNYS